jgi:hypothetical protein
MGYENDLNPDTALYAMGNVTAACADASAAIFPVAGVAGDGSVGALIGGQLPAYYGTALKGMWGRTTRTAGCTASTAPTIATYVFTASGTIKPGLDLNTGAADVWSMTALNVLTNTTSGI